MQRPSLTDDDDRTNDNGKQFLSKSLVLDNGQAKQQQQQQQQQQQPQRSARPPRPSPSVFEQQPPRLGRSLLSNDNWRQETMVDVRINAKAIDQSDQNILFGKGRTRTMNKLIYINSFCLGVDPLPHVREILNELSNAEALLYARQCRVVVAKLRLCWSDVNDDIKSLLKYKEYTEASIEHIRKDLIINKESVDIRKKPKREAVNINFILS